jgi:RNA polymerase sigma-70 factor (ECF subfamily)
MTSLSQMLVENCKRQDTKAQIQFYEMYYKMVYNCCYRILPQAADAEDAMQDSFIKAFDKIHTINDAPIEAWLRRIAINTAIDKLKKRHATLLDLSVYEAATDDEPCYGEEETAWKAEQVKNAINTLPDGYRVVLTLHLLEGYEYDEIASILKIKESSARGQYTRARQKLAELLKLQNITQ